LSIKRSLETLKSLGLTETEAQIYVFLAKKGPHDESDLTFSLNIPTHQLCVSLEGLVSKHLVFTIDDCSVKYCAFALERVLAQLLKATKEQAKDLQTNRDMLLSTWRSMIEKDSDNS
jgi:sugar-specific transcriptional regulator TrmB